MRVLSSPACLQLRSARVAVVGAGAAGLVAARVCRDAGHHVTVFEAGQEVGGTWLYNAQPGSHSSLYASLRTNLPREVMAFASLPFTTFAGDERRFPGHAEVQAYLSAFAEPLLPLIHFGTSVLQAEPLWQPAGPPGWALTTSDGGEHVFDALLACTGHYSVPRLPPVAGLGVFPGRVEHTHEYRTPDAYSGRRVLVVGAAASGEDISEELAAVAELVVLSAASFATEAPAGSSVRRKPMLAELLCDGQAVFTDGSRELFTNVLLATGYVFSYPYLPTGVLSGDDNALGPLFEQLFAVRASSLALIGLPWKVAPFPLMEMQAQLVARVLSGAALLPAQMEMERHADEFEARLSPRGPVKRRHAHAMSVDEQFDYLDRLATLAGVPPLPPWRKQLFEEARTAKRLQPGAYRG